MIKSKRAPYDQTISIETKIYFSKIEAIGSVVVGVIAAISGIYFFAISDYGLGTFIFLIGILVVYWGVKAFNNTKPQIILNEAGIRSALTPFHSWQEIKNERVTTERHGRSAATYLIYSTKNGFEKIDITGLDVKKSTLEKLLIVYRERNRIKT